MKTTEGAEGQNGAFSGQTAPRGRGAVPLIGNCPSAALSAPVEGQSQNGFTPPIRILLSEATSRHLEAAGAECFLIIAKDKSDAHTGRWVIHLQPCSYKLANAAVRVSLGLSTEKRPRATPATPKAPLTSKEIRSA